VEDCGRGRSGDIRLDGPFEIFIPPRMVGLDHHCRMRNGYIGVAALGQPRPTPTRPRPPRNSPSQARVGGEASKPRVSQLALHQFRALVQRDRLPRYIERAAARFEIMVLAHRKRRYVWSIYMDSHSKVSGQAMIGLAFLLLALLLVIAIGCWNLKVCFTKGMASGYGRYTFSRTSQPVRFWISVGLVSVVVIFAGFIALFALAGIIGVVG